jgi:hypothetical protein
LFSWQIHKQYYYLFLLLKSDTNLTFGWSQFLDTAQC